MIVYLAGLISTTHPESLAWRDEAAFRLVEGWGLDVLSPLRGKDMSTSKDGGITVDVSQGTSKDCILRDYNDIQQTDLILVNLNDWGEARAQGGSAGTMFELAWAWTAHTPVVAICPLDNQVMRTHPFVREAVTHYCETVEEAIEFIGRYYT